MHRLPALLLLLLLLLPSALPLSSPPRSFLSSISVRNLAIIDSAVTPPLSPFLTVVTGETGAGKSLVTSAIALVRGEPARTVPLLADGDGVGGDAPPDTEVSLSFSLVGRQKARLLPHLPPSFHPPADSPLLLTASRTIRHSRRSSRSACSLSCPSSPSPLPLSVKQLSSLIAPLVTTVSAASAATALGDVPSRLAALDVGVPAASLSAASASLRAYSKKRAARAALERELETSLPPSAAGLDGGERDLEMLEHWAGELEGFEERRKGFFERAAKEVGEAEDEADPAPPSPASDPLSPPSLADLAVPLRAASEAPPPDGGYELLEDLKSAIASFSQMFESASLSLAHLSSISEASSAVHALTQARDALYDVSFAPAHPLYDAVEDSHDLLTAAEKALSAAAAALEARVLQQMELRAPRLPLEEVDEVLAEWHTLARKHGVAPGALLSAGRAIRNELDGNNRARELLPAARREEEEALADYKEACRALTVERERAGELLGGAVSARLKDLGMSGAEFKVQVFERGGVDWEEGGGGKARWGGPGSGVGVDAVDFLLKNNNAGESKKKKKGAGLVGGWGKVEAVASSGERARILLLIETALPGAVAAAGGGVGGAEAEEEEEERGGQGEAGPGPVLTLYDEIDSHVGGRAAVAVARLLSRQGAEANQIVSITHNAAIGSVADEHLVVEKSEREEKGGGVRVTVGRVQGEDREREIARMAAGSMAETESLEFARAMLREGREHTQTHE